MTNLIGPPILAMRVTFTQGCVCEKAEGSEGSVTTACWDLNFHAVAGNMALSCKAAVQVTFQKSHQSHRLQYNAEVNGIFIGLAEV